MSYIRDGFGRWGHDDIAEMFGFDHSYHAEMNGWIRHSPEEGDLQHDLESIPEIAALLESESEK